ncbi:TMV resistance protein N-like [Pyrus ussuriensis x Pyrus communis]|uniref:TMV resistance protein N-like n=1 Tax=Pyrus ussuriensis x Pyrus communis TaxID=2448454 RepID=A0A5N5HHQ2_9ROSA|nr:TMV resistance protein N-like [Pyrus ussuriensis x Pyrus communis]
MASSSSSVPDWKYDVFLNFRGEDTRRTFIGHLYKALVQNSINTFIDAEELRKGNCLSQLLTAISDSRLSIVVFSQNYGSSTWCLKELVQILQCMDQKKQIVIPIFYEVDPSHVRKIEGSFEEAFSKHEHDPNADMEEVQRWRSALQRAPDLCEAPLDMQAEILSSITNTKVGSSQILRNGFQKMMERVGKKKVLFVLDNVESSSQIEALIGKQPAFGGGSRIIITTRDKQSLSRLGDQIYEPELLNDDDAFELFVQYAFSTKQPTEEYIDLSGHFIKYAQGLPLALKVLGAFLDNKSVLVWKDELKKIARNPHLGIQKVLRTSFDELDGLQKEIFLDIACFFKQMKKDFATRIMEGCDFHPHTGLDVLVGRALVSISSDGVLEMHDLIEEMGREIVRQEYIKEPGRRSRLWSYEDVHHVLNKKTATEAVESIIVHWPHSDNVVELDTAFVKMTKLRLLRVHTHSIEQLNKFGIQWQHEDLKFLSEKLSYLFWHKCPLKSLSSYFNPENLVDIDMQYSWVEHLWKGTKPLGKLKIINLKGSHRLKETPDFTEAKNLEKLILVGCTNLYEVHPSISALEKLVLLDLSWCGKLKTFSSNICIKSLETLDLSFCSILEKFPEISEVTEKLSKLYLQGTAIKELPRSINNLMGLVTLNLEYCRELKILPSSIVQLKSLQFLNLSGCPKLKAFPRNVGNMEGLRELRLDETSVEGLCPSISSLQNLESLSLKQCKKLHSLPSSIHMRSLRNLNLSGCSNLDKFSEIPEVMNLSDLILDGTAISELPSSIKNFTRLVTLSLKDCRRLKILPGSIHMKSLQALNSVHMSKPLAAEKLLSFQGLQLKNYSMCNLLSLEWLTLHGCSKLSKLPEDLWYLKHLDIEETGIRGYRPEQRFVTLEDLAQFRSTAPKIKPMSRHEEEKEEKAVAASRRGGMIWGCIYGSQGNGD